jgi:hypothetical protein
MLSADDDGQADATEAAAREWLLIISKITAKEAQGVFAT